jgi:hypothetical protein
MSDNLKIQQIAGQAEVGTVEIHGVGAGDFNAALWESGKLHILPDVRTPLIQPRQKGVFRNIYAPSAVEQDNGWRVFYGAWDGVDSGNDRIYSLFTSDFLDFSDRQTVIEHGVFDHVCNVNVQRLPNGEYKMMCTAYPDKDGLNKPAFFSSPDGKAWNGSPAPYAAKMNDIITVEGYDKYKEADINGMNVLLYEDGIYRLYFNNFKDFGKVYRATSKDGKDFKFEGTCLDKAGCVNDVKKLKWNNETYYLMGLHFNQDVLWYSLSKDGMNFSPMKELVKNLGDKDRYMVAIGWVTKGNRVLGFLYGAGEVGELNRNRIWGRWLQKKVVFTAEDGSRYEPSSALGPDRQIIKVSAPVKGYFQIFAEDGETQLTEKLPATLTLGGVYVVRL